MKADAVPDVIRVLQTEEHHKSGQHRYCAVQYAYGRSSDRRKSNQKGQDYLIFHGGQERIVFALCDGVSRSLRPDRAAEILGDALLAWLKTAFVPTDDESEKSFAVELRD